MNSMSDIVKQAHVVEKAAISLNLIYFCCFNLWCQIGGGTFEIFEIYVLRGQLFGTL